MKKFNDDTIINRCLIALNCKKRNDLASLLNISPQNLSGYIARGTFINLIQPILYDKGINIDWIKTGKGEMLAGSRTESRVAEPQEPYPHRPSLPSGTSSESLLDLTADVLNSDTIFRTALESNVRAFSEAVNMRKKLAVCEARLNQQAREIEELRTEIDALRTSATPQKKIV